MPCDGAEQDRAIEQTKKEQERRSRCGAIAGDVERASLGGNKPSSMWVPDLETRDDRESVAGRQDLSEKQSKIKTQVKTLLKRHGLEKPEGMGSGWDQTISSLVGRIDRG